MSGTESSVQPEEGKAPAVQTVTRTELGDLVKSIYREAGLPEVLDRLEEMAAKQTDWFAKAVPSTTEEKQKKEKTSSRFGMIMRALAAAKGDAHRAAVFAEKHYDDEYVTKALAAGDETAGGFLVPEEVSAEIIELLRAPSVVRSLNPIMVPLDSGTLRIPKHTTGASGGWIGENANAPKTEPAFGQVVLSAKKYASLVPISNDLIRRGGPKVDTLVRDDLVGDIATSTDLAFIRGSGAAGEPKGLDNYGTGTAMTATPTVAKVMSDLGSVIQRMGDDNVRFIRPGWIMEWRTWRYLWTLLDSNSNPVFKDEMNRGTLLGWPFRVTSQIPRNLGGGTESVLYAADFADVIIGESTQVLLDVSSEAAYHDGSNVVAAFSLDQAVVRAIIEVDLGIRHEESIERITGLTWGA
jgi:HK97 family phage major capsid protein